MDDLDAKSIAERDGRAHTVEQLLFRICSEISSAMSGLLILDTVYIPPEAQKIIEQSAATFFEISGIALQRGVVMALARLTDRPQMGKYPTICARRLVESLSENCDSGARAKLTADVNDIEQRAKPLRDWRDKYIAHNDLEESFSKTPLRTISVEIVREVATRLGVLAEETGDLLKLETVRRPHLVTQTAGGRRLLHVLRRGLVNDDGHDEPD